MSGKSIIFRNVSFWHNMDDKMYPGIQAFSQLEALLFLWLFYPGQMHLRILSGKEISFT